MSTSATNLILKKSVVRQHGPDRRGSFGASTTAQPASSLCGALPRARSAARYARALRRCPASRPRM